MSDPLRLYRFLLKLYPARFREEYGTPLEQQFADEYREAGGRLARFSFWTRTVRDLAVSVPLELLRELTQDLRYSFRMYSQRPVVTLLAIIALALAIGATTGVFSVVNALLLKSLPFRSPERMVQLGYAFAGPKDSPAAFYDWRHRSSYLEDAARYSQAEVNLNSSAQAVRVKLAETTANFFTVVGREPEIGRSFASGEDVPGKDAVAIISHSLWEQSFGGDPRVLGSVIHLNGAALTIIGIAPAGFDYPSKTAVWTPTDFDFGLVPKGGPIYDIGFGRLKPGLSRALSQSMFDADRERLEPGALKQDTSPVKLIPLREQLAGPVRRASLVLLGAVFFVLLIACANVANLLLTRITERRKELVLRTALGASRARLMQQLITESILLTSIAAAAGMLVAEWAARLATAAQPAELLTVQNYTILDWRVAGFAIVLAVVTGFLFGVLPASLIGRLQPADEIVRTTTDTSNIRVRRLRSALVSVQMALTLALLGGSIVMGRGFLKMLDADLGYQTDHVVTMTVSVAGTRHSTGALRAQYYSDALDRLRKVPGVESAGAIDSLPLATKAFMGENITLASGREVGFGTVMWATPAYFSSMRSAILAGRDFTTQDSAGTEPVAIVNEEFALKSEQGQTLIGQKFKSVFGTSGFKQSDVTVVGIARTVRYYSDPDEKIMPAFYLPVGKTTPAYMTFVARVRGKTEAYLPVCRDAIQSVDRQVPVFNVKTLDQRLADSLARPRFYTTAVLFFGGFAMLLAIIGVYGVASYSIAQRKHELGVRIAIGASAERMRWMLLRQSLMPIALGMAVGVAGIFALGQFLRHMLDAAQRMDVGTCAIATALLAVVAAGAVWSATQRILRLDPMQILRNE